MSDCYDFEGRGIVSDQSGGEGWWLASDGKWYPPETAPAATAAAPVVPPLPLANADTGEPPKKPWFRRRWVIVTAVILLAVIIAGALAPDDDDDSTAGDDTTTTEADETTTTEAEETTTTAPAPAEPAAPDASPYVVGFGDLSALSFPAGDPGELTVISTGAQDDDDAVTIIVRNNTSDPIGQIEATGTARDAAGALVGSGSSQGFKPVVVAPGEIAYGYVYFDGGFPEGSTFEFDVAGEEVDTYFRPITITEINNTGDAIIGGVSNDTGVDVTGPISVDVLCFAADGTTIGHKGGYAEQSDLADGATGSFSISLYGNECPIGLVAASGYGSL